MEQAREKTEELNKNTEELNKKYQKLYGLLEQKNYSKTKREKNPTTEVMITDYTSSTRYRRRAESKSVLEYIHGGFNGAVFGAWDFLSHSLKFEQLQDLLTRFKKGKFIEELRGKFNAKYRNNDVALKKALATKYTSYLSRRKYQFMCNIQNSLFTTDGGRSRPSC